MKYTLNVLERLGILNIMPKEGSYALYKVKRKLQSDLSFDEKELNDYGVKQTPDGRISWNPAKVKDKEIEIGKNALELITTPLETMEKESKLPDELITVYEKLIENNKDKE